MNGTDIAVKIARLGVQKQDVADRAGIAPDVLSRLIHDRLSDKRAAKVRAKVVAALAAFQEEKASAV